MKRLPLKYKTLITSQGLKMNAVIDLLKSHRSIRKFNDKPIAPELLEEIVQAGQAAATSSFIQATTIVRVTDPHKREKLKDISGGQPYVKTAPEFFVFCADMHRAETCCKLQDVEAQNGFTEQFIIATVDVALMAQNFTIAAESLGLGICYIGGLRNDPAAVSELLNLPGNIYPVFGYCMGYPDQSVDIRPRLPVSVIFKQDKYNNEGDDEAIAQYDQVVGTYYAKRLGANKASTWTQQVAGLTSKESRPHMKPFLKDQGFLLR